MIYIPAMRNYLKKDKEEAELPFSSTLDVLSNFTTEILFKRHSSENLRGRTSFG
jgi:hypothetical protein